MEGMGKDTSDNYFPNSIPQSTFQEASARMAM